MVSIKNTTFNTQPKHKTICVSDHTLGISQYNVNKYNNVLSDA